MKPLTSLKVGQKVKDINCQVEHFKNTYKESKVDNIMIYFGTNHIQREIPWLLAWSNLFFGYTSKASVYCFWVYNLYKWDSI